MLTNKLTFFALNSYPRECFRHIIIFMVMCCSSTSVTGLNNNEYQISRERCMPILFIYELNRIAGVDGTCDFVKVGSVLGVNFKFLLSYYLLSTFVLFYLYSFANLVYLLFLDTQGDFMKMPFPDNILMLYMQLKLPAMHQMQYYGCYSEIYRVLKPGQCFAAYEWCMTDSFDPHNQEHQKLRLDILAAEIEIGDGLPDIRLTGQCIDALKKAGFEVMWSKDLAVAHLCHGQSLEFVGLAPKGSQRVQDFLEEGCRGISWRVEVRRISPRCFTSWL
ncbi:hypothetical protein NC651_023365 [Populus alba x Populus x berolinensis]|nr:hypothetical protein NC651_023365 [Populus alba x Populus x berolinensis]